MVVSLGIDRLSVNKTVCALQLKRPTKSRVIRVNVLMVLIRPEFGV